jgi:acyl-coenzyme A thioesterase PaaI-like protein
LARLPATDVIMALTLPAAGCLMQACHMESAMSFSNNLTRVVAKFQFLPVPLRSTVLTGIFGRVVPYVGTSGLRYEELSQERVVVSVRNRRAIQNHIKGVHAAGMALLAETATGFVVGMNLPDDKLLLIKSLKVEYLKRTEGDMRAVATLSPEQIEIVRTTPKGEVTVPVMVTDASGTEPIRCEMIWAWVPRKK